MSAEPEVITRVEGFAGRVTLNRPRALNALTADMCLAITDALLAWREDDAVCSVIIDHAGDRGFCAGGDIRIVAQSGAGDGAEARRFFASEYRMNALLQGYAKPVVAIMDGITMGGGVGISMPARYRVATERTVWAMPEGDIGLFPDVGAGWYLPRLPGEAGAWLALTGVRLKAADCLALGIATHVVPGDRVEALKTSLTSVCPREGGDPSSLNYPFRELMDPRLRGDDRLVGESALVAEHRPAIDRLFAHDTVEAIMSGLQADGSEWALAQHTIIARKCPTTLKVALRLVCEGARRATFAEEMAVEYAVALRMSARPDFIEGVRALIVDKDNAPRWDPESLAGVTDAMVDAIFAPLPPAEAWTPL